MNILAEEQKRLYELKSLSDGEFRSQEQRFLALYYNIDQKPKTVFSVNFH